MFTTKYVKVIDKDSESYNQVVRVKSIDYTWKELTFWMNGEANFSQSYSFSQVIESTKEEYEAQNQPQLISGQEAILKVGDKEITVIIK